MIRRLGLAVVVLIGLAALAGPALSSSLEGDISPPSSTAEPVQLASFFGRPYPYGYTGWGPCIRYVEVETPYGPQLRRVRSCRPILRSAG
jgi:hypothetical protein